MPRTTARGLNLLETLFATTLFSGILVGLLGLWVGYAHTIGRSQNLLAASTLAEAVMEDQMALEFAAESQPPEPIELQFIVNGRPVDITFTREVTVTDRSSDWGPDLKWVTVRVGWNEAAGARDVVLQSYVGWRGAP